MGLPRSAGVCQLRQSVGWFGACLLACLLACSPACLHACLVERGAGKTEGKRARRREWRMDAGRGREGGGKGGD